MAIARDPTKSRAVIAVCLALTAVFVADWVTEFGLARTFALVPQDLVRALDTIGADPGSLDAWLTLGTAFTTLLVHADVMHLLFNLAYLWFFGTLLSQIAGDRVVLLALAVCAVTSAAAFVVNRAEGPPTQVIGASGAISGVAGLYVLLAFRWDTPWVEAWPLARPIPPLHAALVAIVAAGVDVLALRDGGDGVARDAHLGGFAGGLILGALLTSFFPTWERFRLSRLGRGANGP